MTAPADHAATFRRLHHGPGLFVLANAWDAGSAKLIEKFSGAPAIATTSAGVAWSHGFPDGDAMPVALVTATVAAIARVIGVPLTVDLEGGYSHDPASVGTAVAGVIEAGAVGINLEDGLSPPDLLCAKIAAAKQAAARLGVDLFVNARSDVFLHALAPAAARVEQTLLRAERYRDAGADGIFVPGVVDPAEIERIAAATKLPLNVMARPGLPPAAELLRLGVRRLSAGSGIVQALYGRAATLAGSFLREGGSDLLAEGAMPYPKINALIGG